LLALLMVSLELLGEKSGAGSRERRSGWGSEAAALSRSLN